MDTTKLITQFVIDTFLFGYTDEISPSDSLLDTGVIDSTGIMELIIFLEETFNISVADEELVPENLDSIERIAQYVDRKLSATEIVPGVTLS